MPGFHPHVYIAYVTLPFNCCAITVVRRYVKQLNTTTNVSHLVVGGCMKGNGSALSVDRQLTNSFAEDNRLAVSRLYFILVQL